MEHTEKDILIGQVWRCVNGDITRIDFVSESECLFYPIIGLVLSCDAVMAYTEDGIGENVDFNLEELVIDNLYDFILENI